MEWHIVAAVLGGFALLVVGGEGFVRGAVAIARHFGLSPLLIGLTLVGFGTSTPELLTSVQAALAGSPGIAVGNVVGSNIANILLILGIGALICPILVEPRAFRRDGVVLSLAAAIALLIVLWGHLDQLAGLVLLGLLAAYIFWTYRTERSGQAPESADLHQREAETKPGSGLLPGIVMTVVGLGLTLLGARYLVAGASDMARGLGVDETLIGLTVVAVGTSLPELVTTVIAALKREGDIAFGNIIGSNIFNILGILGATALVTPLAIPPAIAALDIWIMLAATAALVGFALTGWRLSRTEGLALLAAYVAYVGWLAVSA